MGDKTEQGTKKQRYTDVGAADMDDSAPLTATNILALFKMAIRDEKLARQEDVAHLAQRIEEVKSESDKRIAEVQQRLDTSVGALTEKVALLQSKVAGDQVSGPSSVASTSGSVSWPGRPRRSENEREGGSGWVPRTIHVRGWAPFGCPTSSKISREEAMRLDGRIREALGPPSRQLQMVSPYVCNHQVTYRFQTGHFNIYDLKDLLAAAIRDKHIQVRDCDVRAALEQSAQRKAEYSQYYGALDRLRQEALLADKWIEDGRALRIYAANSWQELGKPSECGWVWNPAAFADAGLPRPAFLPQECKKGEEQDAKDAEGIDQCMATEVDADL